jgi:hypothetical protein
MVTNRYITYDDYKLLESSLLSDEYHKDTPASFFYEKGTITSVYEDEKGPICFVRGQPIFENGIAIIRLDIQYINNNDSKRNLKAMLSGFPVLEEKAKANGFAGFFFVSDAQLLRAFCIKRLGFIAWDEHALVKAL